MSLASNYSSDHQEELDDIDLIFNNLKETFDVDFKKFDDEWEQSDHEKEKLELSDEIELEGFEKEQQVIEDKEQHKEIEKRPDTNTKERFSSKTDRMNSTASDDELSRSNGIHVDFTRFPFSIRSISPLSDSMDRDDGWLI